MENRRISVATPFIGEEEISNVVEAMREKAISGVFGEFIGRFEREFSQYVGCKHGVAVSNGTVAIHLALRAIGIAEGDEVLVAAYTNMATFFPVLYLNAKPIPIDVEQETGNIDIDLVERAVTARTKAIIVVHMFGHPVDMDPILEIAQRRGLVVIEDAAEAHGALYKGRKAGSLGLISCFSFYANKILTTGEGGMVTTNDADLAERLVLLRSFAYGRENRFMHEDIGYNYRMSNLHAAIGCAQIKKVDQVIASKRNMASHYNQRLSVCEGLQLPVEMPYAKNVYWMYHVAISDRANTTRSAVMRELARKGIETRPGFVPFNLQKIFIERGVVTADQCPVANWLSERAFYLPSGPDLLAEDMDFVADSLLEAMEIVE